MIRLILAALAFLIVAPANALEPRPALWRLADADTTIWLFGTIHALPEDFAWRGPAIEAALDKANRLVLETIIDTQSPENMGALAAMMMKFGRSPGLPPLADRVPAGKREALASLIERAGVPASALDGLETWAATLMLTAPVMQEQALSAAAGVEEQLKPIFARAGKSVEGLETPADQIAMLDTLPEDTQRQMLADLLEDKATTQAIYQRLIAAWARGDVGGIVKVMEEDGGSDVLNEALLKRRNARWTEWLAARLADTEGTIFVAVGAAHLAGTDAVQTMLAAKGLVVERVQ